MTTKSLREGGIEDRDKINLTVALMICLALVIILSAKEFSIGLLIYFLIVLVVAIFFFESKKPMSYWRYYHEIGKNYSQLRSFKSLRGGHND